MKTLILLIVILELGEYFILIRPCKKNRCIRMSDLVAGTILDILILCSIILFIIFDESCIVPLTLGFSFLIGVLCILRCTNESFNTLMEQIVKEW